MENRRIYFGILFAVTAMVLFSLGGGYCGAEQTLGHWTGKMFQPVCHQNPERSFYFLGSQMAVNTRCFGIFSGIWVGWMLIPFYLRAGGGNRSVIILLLVAAVAQIIDFGGNLFSYWTNTNMSRFILGSVLGTATALYIGDLFKSSTKRLGIRLWKNKIAPQKEITLLGSPSPQRVLSG